MLVVPNLVGLVRAHKDTGAGAAVRQAPEAMGRAAGSLLGSAHRLFAGVVALDVAPASRSIHIPRLGGLGHHAHHETFLLEVVPGKDYPQLEPHCAN